MDISFLGARLDISLIERTPEVIDVQLFDASGDRVPLSDMTFRGCIQDACGHVKDLVVEKEEALNVLSIHYEGLRCGAYNYEIWMDSEGGSQLIIQGRIGVIESVCAQALTMDAGERRSFELHIPALSSKRLVLKAVAGNVATSAARRAQRWAEEAKDAAKNAAEEAAKLLDIDKIVEEAKKEARAEVDDLLEEAQDAFQKAAGEIANSTMEELESKKQELEEALSQIDDLKKRVEDLRSDIRKSVVVDDEGFLIIGGENTGVKVKGEPGKSPYVDDEGVVHFYDDAAGEWKERKIQGEDGFTPWINERGFWMARDELTGEIYESPYSAVGLPGINGDSVQRHLIDSVDELPEFDGTCNGGHYYYVPNGGLAPSAVIVVPPSAASGSTLPGSLEINGNKMPLEIMLSPDAQGLAEIINSFFVRGEVTAQAVDDKCIVSTKTYKELVINMEGNDLVEVTEIPGVPYENYDVYAWLDGVKQEEELLMVKSLSTDISTYRNAAIGVKISGDGATRIRSVTIPLYNYSYDTLSPLRLYIVEVNETYTANRYVPHIDQVYGSSKNLETISGDGFKKLVFNFDDAEVPKNKFIYFFLSTNTDGLDLESKTETQRAVFMLGGLNNNNIVLIKGTGADGYEFEMLNIATPIGQNHYSEAGAIDIMFVEKEGGIGEGWVKVGEKNDIATQSIYGLTKLGTDIVIMNGSPVGVNRNGELTIPLASATTPGAILASTDIIIKNGSIIGVDERGRFVGALASMTEAGGVRISCAEECDAEILGFSASGALGVRWASAGKAGAMIASHSAGDGAAMLAIDQSRRLRLNLDEASPIYWNSERGHVSFKTSSGLSVIDGALSVKVGENITIEKDGSLTVKEASASTLGVFKVDPTMSDRAAAPTIGSIIDLVSGYAKKEDVVTIESFDEELKEALKSPEFDFATADSIKDFITRTTADSLYMPKKGVSVMAYDSYSKMPALEDQESDVLYLAPAP